MDGFALAIAERCLAGGTISSDEALRLMEYDTLSAEAAHLRWAAETIARRASNGCGQIYAQIGVDAGPCPVNCRFCSLSVENHREGMPEGEVPLERIVEYAALFDRAGVHLISLMSTALMRFDRYLEIVRAVRAAVSPDMPILANTRDFSEEQAVRLKEAGAQAVYHANRLGEGVITTISPDRRQATVEAARKAGLAIMNGVEPVQRSTAPEELVRAMERAISQKPYCSGVTALTSIPQRSGDLEPASRARAAFLAAIMRLMAGDAIPFGAGGGNVVWVDAGTNPRARDLPVDERSLRRDVARRRKELAGREWRIPDRPLSVWFE